jgi:hypothetical protein
MQFTGKLKSISNDITSGELLITLTANEKQLVISGYQDLKDVDKLMVEVKKYHPKRSLDSNAYAWQLISSISTVLKTSKDAVYELMLQQYGALEKDADGDTIKISLLAKIDVDKLGIHTKYIGESERDGKLFKHYVVIAGSSTYDSKQMSNFIEGIVFEAKELNIETLTPAELEKMNQLWKAKNG